MWLNPFLKKTSHTILSCNHTEHGLLCSMVGFVFLTVINGFDIFLPGRFSASSFLTAYVGIPISLGFTLCIGLCIGVIPGQE